MAKWKDKNGWEKLKTAGVLWGSGTVVIAGTVGGYNRFVGNPQHEAQNKDVQAGKIAPPNLRDKEQIEDTTTILHAAYNGTADDLHKVLSGIALRVQNDGYSADGAKDYIKERANASITTPVDTVNLPVFATPLEAACKGQTDGPKFVAVLQALEAVGVDVKTPPVQHAVDKFLIPDTSKPDVQITPPNTSKSPVLDFRTKTFGPLSPQAPSINPAGTAGKPGAYNIDSSQHTKESHTARLAARQAETSFRSI
jgi:hypothetical protein